MKPTYSIAPDKGSITCRICGAISHNKSDVHHKYCARCGVFHMELQPCDWCDEAVLPGEPVSPVTGVLFHWECGLRSVLGGLNHQLGMCSCCGGKLDPDPPDLTRRQAALAAVQHYYQTHPTNACDQEAPEEIPPPPRSK